MEPDDTGDDLPAEEPVTKPELLGLCPCCRGERFVFTDLVKNDAGELVHAAASPCPACKGAGEMTAAMAARYNAQKHGR